MNNTSTKTMTSIAEDKPPIQSLFQRLERLEADMDTSSHAGHNRWMIPYADLLTLLLGLFLVIFTSGQMHGTKQSPLKPVPKQQTQAAAITSKQTLTPTQQTNAMQTRLQHTLNMKGVAIRQQDRYLIISLKDSILFKPGSADLSPQAEQTLTRLVHELRLSMGQTLRSIRVEGHTDNTPIKTAQFPSNWELSTARATSIVRYLASSGQFPPDQLSAAGYAEFKPIDDNSTIEGKQKNRRVDIVVLKPRAEQTPVSPAQQITH